jgi:hypothetical protein
MHDPQLDVSDKPYDPAQGPQPGGSYGYTEPPKSHGCFFYGCITLIVLGLLVLLLVIAAGGVFFYFANRAIDQYTDTAPATIPTVTLPDDQMKELVDRWKAFRDALDQGHESEIVLTADEVNALIEREPEARGKVSIAIKDDQITAKISIPITLPLKGQRYLNGSGTVTAQMKGDDLDVRLQDLEVKGQRLPPNVKAQVAGKNLAEDYIKDPDNRAMIRKFRSIEVKESKIYIKARDRSKETKDESKETKGEAPKEKDEARPAEGKEAPKTDAAPKAEEPKVKPGEPKAAEPKAAPKPAQDAPPTPVEATPKKAA